jgi:hypothetical protein
VADSAVALRRQIETKETYRFGQAAVTIVAAEYKS